MRRWLFAKPVRKLSALVDEVDEEVARGRDHEKGQQEGGGSMRKDLLKNQPRTPNSIKNIIVIYARDTNKFYLLNDHKQHYYVFFKICHVTMSFVS